MTAIELITDAVREFGGVSHGEALTADEANDSLRRLNVMLDTWSAEKLTIYEVARSVYTLTSGTQTYTLGPTGDFVQTRPVWIERMGIIQGTQAIELPLKMLTTERWAGEVPVKDVQSALATKVYVDGAYPDRNVSFWPYPNVSDLQVAIYWPSAPTTFALLATDLAWPPSYHEALLTNLAVRLVPQFGAPLNPVLAKMAVDTYATLKRSQTNTHLEELAVDRMLVGPIGSKRIWDWRTGDPL